MSKTQLSHQPTTILCTAAFLVCSGDIYSLFYNHRTHYQRSQRKLARPHSISERTQIHIISQNSHSFSKKRPDPLKEVIIWVYYMEEIMFHSGDNIDLGEKCFYTCVSMHTPAPLQACLSFKQTSLSVIL